MIRVRIPDSGVKKAPDSGSGSTTLCDRYLFFMTCMRGAVQHTRKNNYNMEMLGGTHIIKVIKNKNKSTEMIDAQSMSKKFNVA
jgi:hypothetical protein